MAKLNCYPTFQITDDWGRQLRFGRYKDGFWREWLNNHFTLNQSPAREQVSRSAYAAALLRHHEELADEKLQHYEARITVEDDEGKRVLEEWFGPRAGRD